MDGKDWKVITLNEAWGNLADAQAVYTGVPRRLITVVTEEPLELKTLWMSQEEMEAILVEQQDQALEESVEPKPVEGEVDDEEAEVPGFADVDLFAVEVEGVPIDAAPNRLIVNGEEITAESSLRKMREAAKFLKIAIGGAKSKVWAKLVNCHLQAAAGAVDAAAALALRGEQVDPVVRARPREPSVRERELHEVTHQPYMPWCEACIASRAVQDAHPSAVEPDDDVQDMAVIQCDFMYPGNEADEEKSADAPGADEAEGSKWPMLVAADKHSHALLCVPVEQKGGSSLARMVQELYNFILRVSSTAVTIQGDQEPALQAVLRGVQQMRDRQQFRTVLRQTEKGQPMSNGRAERAVRTIKEMARTLRKQIALRCGYSVKPGHPVHLWSFVHGTFLYNAFGIQRRERMTPMQLLGEGKYKGVLLSYGECVMALQANAGKSLRRWRKAVWLGKDPRTGSHLVGGVWGVTTSRSVRRLPSSSAWVASELDKVRGTPWLMLQKSLTVKDNFGVPPILPRVAFAVEDEAASDPESEAEAQAEQQSESVLPDNAWDSQFQSRAV